MKRPLRYTIASVVTLTLLCVQCLFLSAQNCIEYPEIEGAVCGNCTPEGWLVEASSPDLQDPTLYPCNPVESPSGGNVIHLFSNGSNDIEAVSTAFTIDDFNPGEEYYFGMYMLSCGPHEVEVVITINGDDYVFDSTDDWQNIELCLELDSPDLEIYITVDPYEGGAITNTLLDTGICSEDFCCTLAAQLDEEETELCPGEEYQLTGMITGETGGVDIEWESEPPYGINYIEDPNAINTSIIVPDDFDFEGESFIYTVFIEDSECQIMREFTLNVRTSEIPEFDVFLCEIYEDYELPLVSLNDYSGTWEGNMDFDEIGGEVHEYTFSLDPGQDNCIQEWTFEYLIHPEEIITFEYTTVYCLSDDETYYLPEVSEERVEGEWDEDKFTPDELGVGVHEFTFYPDMTMYCAQEYVLYIEVIDLQELTFDLISDFCVKADSIFLPDTSLEGLKGTWSLPLLDLNVAVDSLEIVFTPDEGADCHGQYSYYYTVQEESAPLFDLPDELCRAAVVFEPDSVSMNNLQGTWIPSMVQLDTVQKEYVYFNWTYTGGDEDCVMDYRDSIQLIDAFELTFNLPESLCIESDVFTLPLESVEGVPGYWNYAELNPELLGLGTIDLEFTPEAGFCALPFSVSLDIIDSESASLTFDIPSRFCALDDMFTLPLSSLSGISGMWSTTEIVPNSIEDSINVVFMPDANASGCFGDIELTIYIDAVQEAEFELEEVLCLNGGTFDFPSSSLNGIVGSWSIESFDPAQYQSQTNLVNVFYPGDGFCADLLIIDLSLVGFSDIEFDITNASSCVLENGALNISNSNSGLEYSIDDGVSWIEDTSITDLAAGSYDILLRYPMYDCEEPRNFIIEAPSAVLITELVIDSIEGCVSSLANLEIIAEAEDPEYSIDGGINWQLNPRFEDVAPGDYIVQARSISSPDCMDETELTIASVEETNIVDIEIEDVSDCGLTDGSLMVDATGVALEYSIDGGQTWQSMNGFFDLPSGEYKLLVRSSLFQSCQDSLQFNIAAPDFPIIEDVIVQNNNSCTEANGQIDIIATGNNLEYSIDGGQTWQMSPVFDKLSEGQYNIAVSEQDYDNCQDMTEVNIAGPVRPEIVMLDLVDVSSCLDNDGVLSVVANGNNLEYSIDGGSTWNVNPVFTALSSGDYELLVREQNAPDCLDAMAFRIESAPEIEIDAFEIFSASSCDADDAMIALLVSQSGLEYSIDGAVSWQTDLVFENLSPGTYMIVVRDIDAPECSRSYELEIIAMDCPCGPLSVSFETQAVDCLNPISGSIDISDIEGQLTQFQIEILWDNGEQTFEIDGLTEGWHAYTLYYDFNCEYRDSVYIDSFDPVSFDLLSYDQDCIELGSIEVVNFMGGAGEAQYSIDGINFQENTVFTNLTAQEYQVLVEDLFNCGGSDEAVVSDVSELMVDIPAIEAIEQGQSVILNPLINETTIDSFEWYPLTGVLNPGNLIAEVAPSETTTYTLTVYFGQCIEQRQVRVEVLPSPDIYIPNIFSPEGDINNRRFTVFANEEAGIQFDAFRIYDRWGNLVYSVEDFIPNDEQYAWDGRYGEKEVLPGVYVYVLNYTHRGKSQSMTGSITLVK